MRLGGGRTVEHSALRSARCQTRELWVTDCLVVACVVVLCVLSVVRFASRQMHRREREEMRRQINTTLRSILGLSRLLGLRESSAADALGNLSALLRRCGSEHRPAEILSLSSLLGVGNDELAPALFIACLGGREIEVAEGILPRTTFGEHPQGLPDDAVVLHLAAMPVPEYEDRGRRLLHCRARGWRRRLTGFLFLP